jgi:hypothetical protein
MALDLFFYIAITLITLAVGLGIIGLVIAIMGCACE